MNLEDVYNQLEELSNNLEYYENRLETLKSLVTPQATQFDKIMVDGGKHVDNILKYVEIENKQQLETTILYIKGRMRDLNKLKDKEIDRLAKFGEKGKAVVLLREYNNNDDEDEDDFRDDRMVMRRKKTLHEPKRMEVIEEEKAENEEQFDREFKIETPQKKKYDFKTSERFGKVNNFSENLNKSKNPNPNQNLNLNQKRVKKL